MTQQPKATNLALLWTASLLVAALVLAVALATGPGPWTILDLWTAWLDTQHPEHTTALAVLEAVRLPRVLGSFLVGAALSLAGVLLQAATRNPLADPYLMGTSAGATLGAVLAAPLLMALAATLGLPVAMVAVWGQPVAALAGSLLAVWLAFALAQVGGPARPERVLLAGLTLTAFAGAATSWALFSFPDKQLRAATQWMMGGVSVPSLWALLPATLALTGASLHAVRHAGDHDALALGLDGAAGLGLPVQRRLRQAVLWSSVLAAVAVSLAGIVGFVGLLVPHGLRGLVGTSHRRLSPLAVLLGGALVCGLDAASRVLVAPAELPLGILTAICGAPVLGWLLWPARKAITLPHQDQKQADTAAVLACQGLGVVFPGQTRPALQDVTCQLQPGQLVALLGENGSGKSTLLRLWAGQLTPGAGQILWSGQRKPPPLGLAWLPQAEAVEAGLTVRELVGLGRAAHLQDSLAWQWRGTLPAADALAVEQALAAVDLTELATAQLQTLSGGQRQRARLGAVLAHKASIVLLDEPTASLDRQHSEALLTLLAQRCRNSGWLVVVSLHDEELARRFATRTLVIHEGRLNAQPCPND
jgi:iron complex transport system permease protein